MARFNVLRRLICPSACPLLQRSSIAFLMASISLRKTLAKCMAKLRILANSSEPFFKASTFLACRLVSWPRGFMHKANGRNYMAGIRITNRFRSALFCRNIIRLSLFGVAPNLQQALQIGTTARVAAVLDVVEEMTSDAVSILPAFGQKKFQNTTAMSDSMLPGSCLEVRWK